MSAEAASDIDILTTEGAIRIRAGSPVEPVSTS